jgi:hypothetical protein
MWLKSKQCEVLECKRPRKSPDTITVRWPIENLEVLTQDRHDTSTKLRNVTEGTLMMLKYERSIQNLWLSRPPIDHARVMSVGDFKMLAQACGGLWCDQASEEGSLPYKLICSSQSRCRNRSGNDGVEPVLSHLLEYL